MTAMKKTRDKGVSQPGPILKAARKRKHLTLAQLSRLTSLPVSTLSKVENDKLRLSFDKLVLITRGLDLDISELFGPKAAGVGARPPAATPTGRLSVTRAGDGKVIATPGYSQTYLITELLNKQFTPLISELKARTLDEVGELSRHDGEELDYVLQGAVDLHTDYYAPIRLEAGDVVYFDSTMGHTFLAAGAGPCRILSICSTPESRPGARLSDSPAIVVKRGQSASPVAASARSTRTK